MFNKTTIISEQAFSIIQKVAMNQSLEDFRTLLNPKVEDLAACKDHLSGSLFKEIMAEKDEDKAVSLLFQYVTLVLLCLTSVSIIGFEKDNPAMAGKI